MERRVEGLEYKRNQYSEGVNAMLLGIDNGCYATKDSTGLIIDSMVEEVQEFDGLTPGAYRLELNGNKYLVGAGMDTVGIDKTENEITKVLTYTVLAKHSKPGDINTFKIVVGLPMGHYQREKDNFKDYFLNKNEYEVVALNGVRYFIKIEDVLPFPQSTGAYFLHRDKFKDRHVGVIDWGGMTIDCSKYNHKGLEPGTYFSTKNGMKVINTSVKDALNAAYGTNLKERDMEYIYKHGFKFRGEIDKQANDIIDAVVNKELDGIFYQISNKDGWDFDTMDIIFCGGGALALKKYIVGILPYAEFLDDPQFANAFGFGKVAAAEWQND